MSLLREIQNDLASTTGDVATVLRKCRILAARLRSEEFSHWVVRELNGYPESQPIPAYRLLPIQYFASFMGAGYTVPQAAVPLHFVPEKYREAFERIEFREGVAKAASFVVANKAAMIQRPDLIFALQGKMYPEMNCQAVWAVIPQGEFEQLVSAVKNRVLDFSLQIETENPDAGEASPNTQPVPTDKVHMIFQNTFYGPVGNVAQDSEHFSQTANVAIQPHELVTLVTELTNHLDELGLDAHQKHRAEAQIAILKAQTTVEPDPVIVVEAGRTLRNILEGTIAGLVTMAVQPTVWHTIHDLLALFPH